MVEKFIGFIVNIIVTLIATLPIWLIPLLVVTFLSIDLNQSLLASLITMLKACIFTPWKGLLLIFFLIAAEGIWIRRD